MVVPRYVLAKLHSIRIRAVQRFNLLSIRPDARGRRKNGAQTKGFGGGDGRHSHVESSLGDYDDGAYHFCKITTTKTNRKPNKNNHSSKTPQGILPKIIIRRPLCPSIKLQRLAIEPSPHAAAHTIHDGNGKSGNDNRSIHRTRGQRLKAEKYVVTSELIGPRQTAR